MAKKNKTTITKAVFNKTKQNVKPTKIEKTKAVMKAKSKATAKSKITPNSKVKTTMKPTKKPAAKLIAKTTAKQIKKPATKLIAKTTAKQIKKPAAKLIAKPTAKPTKKPAAKPTAKTSKSNKINLKINNTSAKNSKPTSTKPVANKMFKPMASAKVKPSKIDFNNWVTPLDDRILVQTVAEERITPGGLYIPDTVADVSGNFQGLVVAVGRGHLDKKGKIRPLDVKKGDKVVFSQFSGSKVDFQGESVLFLREADVLGIVNK